MSNVRTTQKVSFNEAIAQMKNMLRGAVSMKYQYTNEDGKKVSVPTQKVSTIYGDWYGECNYCPANDTMVSHIHLLLPTNVTLEVEGEVPFGDLMDAIEENTVGKCCT